MRLLLNLLLATFLLTGCKKYTNEEFFAAIQNGDTKTVQKIINQRDMTQVKDGNLLLIDEATLLLKVVPAQHAPNEKPKSIGFSGLWWAVNRGNPEMIKILLQQKFDLTEKHIFLKDENVSLLEIVATIQSCNPAIIKIFAQHGADFDAQRYSLDRPAILVTADNGNWDCVEALIDAGVDTSVKSSAGTGLLRAAVLSEGRVDIDDIIKKIKNFNPKSSDSNMALLIAAYQGKTDAVKDFLNRGFNKCIRSQQKGLYARDLALENKHTETAALLPTKAQCISEGLASK